MGKKKVKSIKDLRDKYKYKRKVTKNAKGEKVEYDESGHFVDGASAKESDKNLLEVAREKLKEAKDDIRYFETSIMKYSKKVPVKSIDDLRKRKKERDKKGSK